METTNSNDRASLMTCITEKEQGPNTNLGLCLSIKPSQIIPIALRNGRNWCYLNSVFQALRNIKHIAEYLSSFPVRHIPSIPLPDDALLGFSFIWDFQRIISDSTYDKTSLQELTATKEYIRSYSKSPIRGNDPQDGHKFLMSLLNSIMTLDNTARRALKSIDKDLKMLPLQNTVRGLSNVHRVCQKCSTDRKKKETWKSLGLPVLQSEEVCRMVESHFGRKELLDGLDSSFCETCGYSTPTLISYSLFKGPEVLILRLPNAEFVDGSMRKGNHTVQIPKNFGMMQEDEVINVYGLSAALVHIGEHAYSGHYAEYSFLCDDNCLRSDDECVYHVSPQFRDDDISFCHSDETPYVLIYTLKAKI